VDVIPETSADAMIRRIVHMDMDAFYASVEQRDRPELRGRPVAVGGSPESRGVVAAASYEARRHGVRSAMPMSQAVRLCSDLVIVPPDFTKYRSVSHGILTIYREVTRLVEPLSLDEAYLDVTQNTWGETLGVNVARRLKAAIYESTGLTASAGVAPNKFLAKIASAWRKPDGLTVVAPERIESFLQKLPVDALWGVGPVTAKRLRARGIDRVVDIRAADPEVLRAAVGSSAEWLQKLAIGEDDRAVEPDRPSKSSSSECTYAEDLTDLERIREQIATMARDNALWLGRKRIVARTVTIKVRYSDFVTITRSHSDEATNDPDEVVRRAVALLEKTEAGRRPVRLLGAAVHNFESPGGAPESAHDDPQLRLVE
jgi:DNA polymerase-4